MGVLQKFEYHEIEALRVGKIGDRVNTACLLFRIGETVIDTGPPNQWRKIKTFLQERKIRELLITHHHEDHGGNAALIQESLGPKIYAHKDGIPLYKKRDAIPLYRRLVWGNPKHLFEPLVLPERVELEGGIQLVPIHCPGHALDLACFHEPNRGWLFSGDLYITGRPKFLRRGEDPLLEIASIENLLAYDFDTVFCSHRGKLEHGKDGFVRKLNYMKELRENVHQAVKAGLSLRAIRDKLLGKEEILSWVSFGDFSKLNLIRAFADEILNPQPALTGA